MVGTALVMISEHELRITLASSAPFISLLRSIPSTFLLNNIAHNPGSRDLVLKFESRSSVKGMIQVQRLNPLFLISGEVIMISNYAVSVAVAATYSGKYER